MSNNIELITYNKQKNKVKKLISYFLHKNIKYQVPIIIRTNFSYFGRTWSVTISRSGEYSIPGPNLLKNFNKYNAAIKIQRWWRKNNYKLKYRKKYYYVLTELTHKPEFGIE